MTIAVSIDGVGYDAHELLASEQRRISGFLTFASPRDINDLSQIYKYTWPMNNAGNASVTVPGDVGGAPSLTVSTDFNTLIQISFDVSGRPVYGVYLRDNAGVLHYLSGWDGTVTQTDGQRNVVVATPALDAMVPQANRLIGKSAALPDGTTTVIQAGDIVQNPGGVAGGTPAGRTVVGRAKLEAESGLSLAQINLRIAEINSVIETLAKVLSTQSDMFNAASGLVR